MTGTGLTSRKFWREELEQESVGLLEAGTGKVSLKCLQGKMAFKNNSNTLIFPDL